MKPKPKESDPSVQMVATNRKARHEYHILEMHEAGIALVGTEVKSIRQGRCNLQDAYAHIVRGEVYLENMHISPYDPGNRFNHEPRRQRKLLLHRREIRRLIGKTQEKGLTLIPLKIYFRGRHIKIELGLAKGKRQYDKREAITRRETDREMRQSLFRRR